MNDVRGLLTFGYFIQTCKDKEELLSELQLETLIRLTDYSTFSSLLC